MGDGKPPALLDVERAAAYLGVAQRTLLGMVRRGELPHTGAGRGLRFRVVDLDAYLQERTDDMWEGGPDPEEEAPG